MSKTTKEQMDSLRTQLEQLRIEASLPRKRVSEAARDLLDYCEKNKQNDMLLIGVPDSQNPYQEKKSCTIL